MKARAIVVFIVCFIVSLNVAFADPFIIHSGIQFGMTMEEVLAKEKEAGFEPEISNKGDTETEYFYCDGLHKDEFVSVNGQIAGQKGAHISYHFDKEGKLVSADYLLDFSLGTNSEAYKQIREALINKYDSPFTTDLEIWHNKLKPDAYSRFASTKERSDKINGMNRDGYSSSEGFNYNDTWLIQQDNGDFVVISGVEWYSSLRTPQQNMDIVCVEVGYQLYPQDAVQDVLSFMQNEAETYADQLENDL